MMQTALVRCQDCGYDWEVRLRIVALAVENGTIVFKYAETINPADDTGCPDCGRRRSTQEEATA